MSRTPIRDKSNRTLGYIETMSDGRQNALSANNRTLGYFDPRRNKTTDASNRTLSEGNILAGLIYNER